MEFDPQELRKLVDNAIATSGYHHNDTQMFALLDKILPAYLNDSQIHEVFNAIRQEYTKPSLDINTLHTQVKHCHKCPSATSTPFLPQWNTNDPLVIFVSPWPIVEQQLGRDLVQSLKEAGFTSDKILLTSLIRCFDGDADNCRHYLFSEIELLKPNLIVLFGSVVTKDILGINKISEIHGQVFWAGPWAIMPVLDPAGALGRKGSTESKFKADLLKASKFL